MVSRESEYLIHIAEKQVERLNKYLYLYQKNNEIENDILNSSLSPCHLNNYKCCCGKNMNMGNNEFGFRNEVQSNYKVIGTHHNSSSLRIARDCTKKKQSPQISSNNIRDWRNGISLVKKTLGPNSTFVTKSPTTKSQSISPNSSKKKDKLSTFWNEKNRKRHSKSPHKAGNSQISDPCTKKKSFDKSDIQKYIKRKQKCDKEKQMEANITTKFRKETIRASLNNLQHHQYDRFSQYKSPRQSNVHSRSENYECKSGFISSVSKPKLPTPIYDELARDGFLEYMDIGNSDYPFPNNLSAKCWNGLNSTVDSGIETGEWYRSMTPEKFRISYDRIDDNNWSGAALSSHLPKSSSQIELRRDKKFKDSFKSKSGYHEKLKDNMKKNCLSATSSNGGADLVLDQLGNYLNDLKKSGLNISQDLLQSDSKSSEISSNIKISSNMPDMQHFKSSTQQTTKDKTTGSCVIQDLKDALYQAQLQLNIDAKESDEVLSERISQAVQKFLKTKESTNSSARGSSCISPRSSYSPNQLNFDSKAKTIPMSESNIQKKEPKKDFSSELEDTNVDLEACQNLTRIPNLDYQDHVSHDFTKISEEKIPSDIINSKDNVLASYEIDEKIPSINVFKQNLQYRHQKASEVIKLTKELHKESRRVIRLEKKAFEVSKKFIPKLNKKHVSKDPNDIVILEGSFNGTLNEMQKLTKPVNTKSKQSDKIIEILGSDQSSQSQTSVSENEEITMSEITTTLTDQSELEAHLLALQSEMEKKKQIVLKLKKRQKNLKLDRIKQREVVLQKQIEMYDNYIDKLQLSMNQISNKFEDNISDDSHTLTGSNTNLNDLDSKLDPIEKHEDSEDVLNSLETLDKIENVRVHKKKDLFSLSSDGSIDSLMENNRHIDTENVNFEDLYTKENKYQNEIDKINENKENDDIFSIFSLSKENVEISSITSSSNRLEIFFGDVNDDPEPQLIENSMNISAYADVVKPRNDTVKNKSVSIENDESFDPLDDLVLNNMSDNGMEAENVLHHLYLKEFRYDGTNTSVILDNLLFINDNTLPPVDLQRAARQSLEIFEIRSESSEKQCDEKEKPIEHLENTTEANVEKKESSFLKKEEEEEESSSITDSIKIINNDQNSQVELNSSSSIRSEKSISINLSSRNEENSLNILIPKFIDVEKIGEPQLPHHETIPNIEDDDNSSISDIDSIINFIEDDSLNLSVPKLNKNIFEKPVEIESTERVSPPTPVPQTQNVIDLEEIYDIEINEDVHKSLRLSNVEDFVDVLFNKIILNEIDYLKLSLVDIVEKEYSQVSVSLITSNYQTSGLIEEKRMDLMSPMTEKIVSRDNLLISEDFWEISDMTVEDPWKTSHINIPETDVKTQKPFNISTVDKNTLNDKISWLVPLKSEFLDPLIQFAIKHVYELKTSQFGSTEDILKNAQDNLPPSFTNDNSVVTYTEITTALFDPNFQQPLVDKRLVFKMIVEIFLEIFAFEKHLPQSSWIHSSFMLKSNVYSLWKGDTPPQSYDLVRKIVETRINLLLDQKYLTTRDSDSQSKIIRWCIRQQKDDVDRLLITDLQKEENEWIYYDKAEEEVKFQIAEEIYNFIIIDTISWMKSISNLNLD